MTTLRNNRRKKNTRSTRNNMRKKNTRSTRKKVYDKRHYSSSDGMLTSIWGPGMWHYLHTMSFNYPVNPTNKDKKHYKDFIINMKNVLPCRHCRDNLENNFKVHPLEDCHLKNRDAFSRYVYKLHEIINKMLGKKSNLTFCQVRERYEHFRSRCTDENLKLFNFKDVKKKEKGCTEPLYGKKAKCVIKIIPQEEKCETLQIDKKCLKQRHQK